MDRILEPELMTDEAQALAYSQADFAQVNQGFVDRFRACFPKAVGARARPTMPAKPARVSRYGPTRKS